MSKRQKNKPDEVDKINVREKLNHNVLDLSLMNISIIPVEEIKTLKRATVLDLSNNVINIINADFTSLIQLTKLDLSKNKISSIADEFGNLVNLRHLDLYDNQIERLPLSFGRLKKLKYLDLKNNPLNPVFSKIIGTCTDQKDCVEAARKAVSFMADIEKQVIADRRKEKEQKDMNLENQPSATDDSKEGKNKPEKRKKTKNKKHLVDNNGTEVKDSHSVTANNSQTSSAIISPQETNEIKKPMSKTMKYFSVFTIAAVIGIGFIVISVPELSSIFFNKNDMEILEEFIK